MPDSIVVRRAKAADAEIVARHRVGMFRDMGRVSPVNEEHLDLLSRAAIAEMMRRDEYIGFLGMFAGDPERVLAGAGVQVRRVLPFPRRLGVVEDVAAGRQALVVNVYTEPGARRRGLARRLMYEVMHWAREAGIESLVLHAAPDGRALYESLGFQATNEMRYMGDIERWTMPVPATNTGS